VIDRDSAARYVIGRRAPEGGYCFYRTPEWGVEEPNALDTLAALESLRLLGIDAPAPEATGQWLRGLQSPDGRYQTLTTGWATLRALHLLGTDPDRSPRDWLGSWVPVVLDSEHDRDWRAALVNVLRVLELSRLVGLGFEADQRQALMRLLDAAAAGDGGRWARPGADLETTAVALRVIALVGLPSEGDAPNGDFLHCCEDAVLGLRFAPTTAVTSAGALWGGLSIAVALGVPLRNPRAVSRSIARLQRPNGGLGARDGAIPRLRDTWLGVHAACLLDRLQEEPGL
jgi:hypothetical protein